MLTRRHMMALGAAALATPVFARPFPITHAAASLKTVLDQVDKEIAPLWPSYGGSGALARQILRGAPADIFVSANPVWMDVVEEAGRLVPGSRADLLGNQLVLVGGAGAEPVALSEAAPRGRIAMGYVNAVPAGQYGKAALVAMGLWDQMRAQIVETDSVRAALVLAARGEVPYAVTYLTDAIAEPRVGVLHRFDPDLHPPIRYPIGLLSEGARPAYDALRGPDAAAIYVRAGFEVL